VQRIFKFGATQHDNHIPDKKAEQFFSSSDYKKNQKIKPVQNKETTTQIHQKITLSINY